MRALLLSHAYVDPARRGKAAALARLGVEPLLVVPERWVDAEGRLVLTPHTTDGGIRVVPIPMRGRWGAPSEARWNGRALRRLLSDARPAVVQVEEAPETPVADTALRLAARLRLPAVACTRDQVTPSLGWRERHRRRRGLRRASLIAAASEPAAALARSVAPDTPMVVLPPSGITPPLHPRHTPHDGLVIGFVGRLVPERGLDLLFRACVRLLGSWRLEVVGSGPDQHELEALAEQLGIAARVTWRGALSPAAREAVFAGLDCLVVPPRSTPTWRETTGATVLEGMARELALVGTASGIVPELIGDAGLVVPEDDVGALATALQQLLDTPDFRVSLGAAARRRVLAEYTEEAVARRTLECWRDLLAPRAG